MVGISYSILGCTVLSLEDPVVAKTEALKKLLPQPKEPTAWSTEVLFQEFHPPETEVESLQQCKKEMQAMGENVLNEEQLDKEVQLAIFTLKRYDKFLVQYHWCFYDIMRSLDRILENEVVSLDEKIKKFYTEMTKLWVIAEALDFHLSKTGLYFDKETYFSYLRTRFLQISKNKFGQDVTVVSPPFRGRKIFNQYDLPQVPEPGK